MRWELILWWQKWFRRCYRAPTFIQFLSKNVDSCCVEHMVVVVIIVYTYFIIVIEYSISVQVRLHVSRSRVHPGQGGESAPRCAVTCQRASARRPETKDKLILYTRHLIWMWIAWSATNGRGEQWPAPPVHLFVLHSMRVKSTKSKRSTDNSVLWYGHSNGGPARRLIAYNIKCTW